MGLSDPFSTVYQGQMNAQPNLNQGVADLSNQVAQQQQLQDQRKMVHDLLKQTGQLTETTEDPSVDELKQNLKDFGSKTGRQVNFNISPTADDDQAKKFLVGISKAYGVPLPQPKIKTTLNLAPGTNYDLIKGDLSMTGQKKEKTLPEQIAEYSAAQKAMTDQGLTGQISVDAKGGSIKSPTTSRYTMPDADAKSAAERIVSGADVPANFSKFQYGQISKYLPSDFDSVKANTDYFVNKTGASGFQKLYNTIDFAERRYSKNAQVALAAAKDFNPDIAPVLKRALLQGSKEIAGDPKASRVLASILTVANEYAKIATNNGLNGNLTDTASAKAQEMIDYAATYGQLEGLIGPDGVLTQDTQNAMGSLDEVKARIASEIGMGDKGKGVAQAAGLQPQAQPAQASGGDYNSYLQAIGQ